MIESGRSSRRRVHSSAGVVLLPVLVVLSGPFGAGRAGAAPDPPGGGPVPPSGSRPNVLFIAVDDLRPELGCYGVERAHSPRIDDLAAGGVLFVNASCMVPTCGASRASLMTGIRPARDRFVNYLARAERDAPGAVPLHTWFRRHGWHTVSLGKVLHHPDDHEDGWTDPPWRPRGSLYALEESIAARRRHRAQDGRGARGPPFERADVDDTDYRDGRLAARAVSELRRLGEGDQPFFLAVGFFKPHLPFCAPERYWRKHDPESIGRPPNAEPPEDVPAEALHRWGELRAYAGVPPEGPLPDELARELIHGYLACTSFVDAQVGKLLDALDALELAERTIVVLWGDHGWNLGEHGLWCKHCCFETSMRAPLIVRTPGLEPGRKVSTPVEFIDIYPSLCELAGLPLPDHLQGRSLAPALRGEELAGPVRAFGRYRRGDTVRTPRYRYTEYTRRDGTLLGRMLYDHREDPGETVNLAARPEQSARVQELARALEAVRTEAEAALEAGEEAGGEEAGSGTGG